MLPIPELEPFRLSRQMRGVLAPHDALAVIGAPMAAALHALRGGADILEARSLGTIPMYFVQVVPLEGQG